MICLGIEGMPNRKGHLSALGTVDWVSDAMQQPEVITVQLPNAQSHPFAKLQDSSAPEARVQDA